MDATVAVERDVPAAMRDGTLLRADVYRPAGASELLPALVARTPYNKAGMEEVCRTMAARGYIAIVQDIRGRYASDGEWRPMYDATNLEPTDGYDTVEWAARLPGCTGDVGTFGGSYVALTQWRLAPTRPPHLRAMYTSGFPRFAYDRWPGIFRTDRHLQWHITTTVPDYRRRQGLPGPTTVEEARAHWEQHERHKWVWFLPFDEIPAEVLGGLRPQFRSYLRKHAEDWSGVAHVHPEIEVPVYHQTGWYDRLIGAIDHHTAMVAQGRTEYARRNQKLIIGPWTHSSGGTRQQGDRDFGPDAEVHVADLMTPWFDYWLKGCATGVMDEPPVRYFVMGANRWETAVQWPPAGVHPTPFYCHAETAANGFGGDGRLDRIRPGAESPDRFVYDPRDPVMSVLPPVAQDAPGDHRVLFDRQDVLYYTSAPLAAPLKIVGPVEARLFIASSAPDTDFTAILLDVAPGEAGDAPGYAQNLCSGILRCRYRRGVDRPALLRPGEIEAITIPLTPVAHVFRPGHRIAVAVSSSNFPLFDRNHNTGRDYWSDAELRVADQTVFHDSERSSQIVLPVVG